MMSPAGIEQVSVIRLQGHPYQQRVDGEDIDCNQSLDVLAYNAGYRGRLDDLVTAAEPHLAPLLEEGGGYKALDSRIKAGADLTFDEAFSLIAFVSTALNRPLDDALTHRIPDVGPPETHMMRAVALLSAMSTKEAYRGLTAAELAGMAASTVHLDTVARARGKGHTLAFGGMGGDQGYSFEGSSPRKLMSLSTLSALALGVVGETHKHHSYPNTSKVAGQSAIEARGARSDLHSPEAMEAILGESGLLMTSCHNTRTLHTLSHRLKGETINHAIGPLAFTMTEDTEVGAFIGVNEKIHPGTIIDTLGILNDEGYQTYGDSVVFCGTDQAELGPEYLDPQKYHDSAAARSHVRVDEVAPPPYATLAAFRVGGVNAGSYALHAEDFYPPEVLQRMTLDHLVITNTSDEILRNNAQALAGRDVEKASYLAMTVGLGIFVRKYVGLPGALDPEAGRVDRAMLRAATEEGLDVIMSGRAEAKLGQYVDLTRTYAGGGIAA